MELRDLRYFVAAAQLSSFSRAAESLHLSQPSLSQTIKKLEGELGVALFERAHQTVKLTEAGEAFLRESRVVLAQATVAADTARFVANGTIGKLRIGFVDSAALRIMPELIRRYRGDHPAVTLTLTEMSTTQQLAALKAGVIDVGIARGPIWDGALDGICVATEALYVALEARHRLAGRREIAISDLRDEGFVMYPARKGAGLYDDVIRMCNAAGFAPVIAQEANEAHTICGLAASGAGIAIVPASSKVIGIDGLVYRALADANASIERWAVWLRGARQPAVAAFMQSAAAMARAAALSAEIGERGTFPRASLRP